jgi:hypothetical protein
MYVESLSGGKFTFTAGLMTDCYAIFHALNREIFDMKNKLSMNDLAKVANLGAKQMDVYHMLAAAEHDLLDFFILVCQVRFSSTANRVRRTGSTTCLHMKFGVQ